MCEYIGMQCSAFCPTQILQPSTIQCLAVCGNSISLFLCFWLLFYFHSLTANPQRFSPSWTHSVGSVHCLLCYYASTHRIVGLEALCFLVVCLSVCGCIHIYACVSACQGRGILWLALQQLFVSSLGVTFCCLLSDVCFILREYA